MPTPQELTQIVQAQRIELTEYHIYTRLAARARQPHNRQVLERIGREELAHHDLLERLSGVRVRPRKLVMWRYLLAARLLGLTFALKLMERGERGAQLGYGQLRHLEGLEHLADEEAEHERALIDLLHDDRLEYTGSVVLGLNDALVELTGVLAGLTLALAEVRIVASAGLITGIAASLSMAASEYLSARSELGDDEAASEAAKHPLRAAGYTGAAYLATVALLILPFLLCAEALVALAFTLLLAVATIAIFSFYVAIAKDLRFWPRFWEMTGISLGVAALSFALGWGVRVLFGLEV